MDDTGIMMTGADLRFLEQLARRVERLCGVRPEGTGNRHYNAYRLCKTQDLPRLKRKIERWRNGYTGRRQTP